MLALLVVGELLAALPSSHVRRPKIWRYGSSHWCVQLAFQGRMMMVLHCYCACGSSFAMVDPGERKAAKSSRLCRYGSFTMSALRRKRKPILTHLSRSLIFCLLSHSYLESEPPLRRDTWLLPSFSTSENERPRLRMVYIASTIITMMIVAPDSC